ncbi:hypothetical protein KR009_003057, partial [Drosophila setifemur]
GLEQDPEQEPERVQPDEHHGQLEAFKKSSQWFNLADYDCDEFYTCEILEALMPYTQYR